MESSPRDPTRRHGKTGHWKPLRLLRINEPRAHMTIMGAVFGVLGLALWFQPERFANTPSYANLLVILPQHVWSVIYLTASALKILSIWRYSIRALVIGTHTIAVMLVSAWLAAFVVRYLTDDGTTIVNVLSWSVFLYLVVRSALMVDDHIRPGE